MIECNISVIMSIYNESLIEIEQSLQSVLKQTYKNFECIIVVDLPDRNDAIQYLEKIRKKDKRVYIIVNEQNIGLAMSMNKAAELASGKYLARMDADDICNETRFEKQYDYMEKYKYDLTCTDYDFIDECGNFIDIRAKTWIEKDMRLVIPFMNPIHHPTVMMTKKSMFHAGGYRNFPCAQDYDLWMRMFEQGTKMGIVTEKLLSYRIRPNNVSALNGFKQIATIWYIQKLHYERKKKGYDTFEREQYENFLKKKHIFDEEYLEKARRDKVIKDKIDQLRKKNGKISRTTWIVRLFLSSSFYRKYYLWLLINKILFTKSICTEYIQKEKDELWIKLKWYTMYHEKLNVNSPNTFNEKLQWLKLYDRNPQYTTLVDKYAVKQYVAEKIGEEHIIPTLGVWNHFDEIDFESLPNQFVLKCTHDSGGVIICKDKGNFNIIAAKEKIENCLKRNFYYVAREWPYYNVKPQIIAEKYLTDESENELKDYKIFNFSGVPKIIQVNYNRFIEQKINLYDTNWNLIDAMIAYPNDKTYIIERPKTLEYMFECARKLSEGYPFVRTDFCSIEDQVYFGEITFYPGGGFDRYTPSEFDRKLGDYLKLPEDKDAL